jgi:hypothetical protein
VTSVNQFLILISMKKINFCILLVYLVFSFALSLHVGVFRLAISFCMLPIFIARVLHLDMFVPIFASRQSARLDSLARGGSPKLRMTGRTERRHAEQR